MARHLIPLLFLVATGVRGGSLSLSLEAWDRPLDGDAVTSFEVLRKAVDALEEDPALRLAIRYPGGEEGTFRAHSLRNWLIALGVASERLRLRPGSANDDRLELELEGPGK